MATPPPPHVSTPPELPATVSAQSQIHALQAELDAEANANRKAVLQYEIGALTEHKLGNQNEAVKLYLAANNLSPRFRPPLPALMRIFEARRSFTDLEMVHNSELQAATNQAEKAGALVNLAILQADHLEEPEEAVRLLEEAWDTDPNCRAAALMLERQYLTSGKTSALGRVVEKHAEQAGDAELKVALLWEVAAAREAQEDIEGAVQALRSAVSLSKEQWRTYELMERLARVRARPELVVESLEARAALAGAVTGGPGGSEDATALLVKRFGDAQRALEHSAVLWRQAAHIRLAQCRDPSGAIAAYNRALAIFPDDLLLRYEQMAAYELAGDTQGVGQAAKDLLERVMLGRPAAALHFRLAEVARSQGDAESARAALSAAVQADPESAAARAALQDAWLDAGKYQELIVDLEARAEHSDPAGKVRQLWLAGQIAADRLSDAPRAARLLQSAADASSKPAAILRELYGQAMRLGDYRTANGAAAALGTALLDEREHAALLRERYQLALNVLGDEAAASELLNEALNDISCGSWAPEAARVAGALLRNYRLLAAAHRSLAERSMSNEQAAAHLSAAARGLLLSGDAIGASDCLKGALHRAPANPYPAALLEEILLERGAAEEAASLLRDAAQARAADSRGELTLLHAGVAAEAAGNIDLAARSYEDAFDRDPTALSPLWALRRLGERSRRMPLLLSALEALAARESKLGAPGAAAVELAQYYELIGKGELAVSHLTSALQDEKFGLAAALCSIFLPPSLLSAEERDAVWSILRRSATGDFAAAIARERASTALRNEPGGARDSLSSILQERPKDRWARYASVIAAENASTRAKAFIELGRATEDSSAAAQLILHGLRIQASEPEANAAADALALAKEIEQITPGSTAAAVAMDETPVPAGDAELRAKALQQRIDRANQKFKPTFRRAYARALLAAGRFEPAAAEAAELTAADPADLASWELLRAAARERQDWPMVVRACEKLAEHAEGEFRAMLLEEAAAVLSLRLKRDEEAEKKLREALRIDPARKEAFDLLHDLVERGKDTYALMELLATRINAIDSPDELVELLYEQARLLRSFGDWSGALSGLEQLLSLNGRHVKGLCLKAEAHASLQQWEQAVAALRKLADTNVIPDQKRLARIGAADMLEKQLNDLQSAYEELDKLAAEDLADATVYSKMAELALRQGQYENVASCLSLAASTCKNEQRAHYERNAGQIYARVLDDRENAIAAFRGALLATPTDETACQALVELIIDPVDRREVLLTYESNVRKGLEPEPANETMLRKLYRTAVWQEEHDFRYLMLSALNGLKLANQEEAESYSTIRANATSHIRSKLSEASLAALRAPGDEGVPAQIAALISAAAAAADVLSPSSYGASRHHRVGNREENRVRDEVYNLVSAFGLELDEFYWGGDDPQRIAVIAKEGIAHVWVVGKEVNFPLSAAQRMTVARQAMAARLGVASLVIRSSAEEAIKLVQAAGIAAESPLAGTSGGMVATEIHALAPKLSKAMPRKLRKELHATLSSLSGGVEAMAKYLAAARQSSRRAGLLMCGDLRVALEELLGQGFDLKAVNDSPDAMDLVTFSYSKLLLALRREIGLAL